MHTSHCVMRLINDISTFRPMLLAEIVQLLQRIGTIETSVMVSAKKGFFLGWRWEALRIMHLLSERAGCRPAMRVSDRQNE